MFSKSITESETWNSHINHTSPMVRKLAETDGKGRMSKRIIDFEHASYPETCVCLNNETQGVGLFTFFKHPTVDKDQAFNPGLDPYGLNDLTLSRVLHAKFTS